jgi:hypothetical protein
LTRIILHVTPIVPLTYQLNVVQRQSNRGRSVVCLCERDNCFLILCNCEYFATAHTDGSGFGQDNCSWRPYVNRVIHPLDRPHGYTRISHRRRSTDCIRSDIFIDYQRHFECGEKKFSHTARTFQLLYNQILFFKEIYKDQRFHSYIIPRLKSHFGVDLFGIGTLTNGSLLSRLLSSYRNVEIVDLKFDENCLHAIGPTKMIFRK